MATNYEVIYRALAEFADVQKAAAQTKTVLQDLKKTAESEGQAEADAATKAAAAHDLDTAAIKRSTDALLKQAAAAKAANEQVAFGGRATMSQHLSDLDQEKNKRDLLNRAEWYGFSSPQQAESFRQQVYQQTLLRNRAGWQGYTTADQYLNYLDQERARITAQADALKKRAAVLQESTQAYQDQSNAVRGVHESLGMLGTSGASNVQGYQAALAGLPDTVRTRVVFDDSAAITEAVAYGAAVRAASSEVVTHVRLDSGSALLDLGRLHSAMSAIRGPGIGTAGGPSFFTSPAIAQMQTAFDELARRAALTISQPQFATSAGIASMQQSMSTAYPQPPHMNIAGDIRSRAAQGEFGTSQLPTRGEFAAQYGVSTGVIDRALAFLRTTGAVRQQANRLFSALPGAATSPGAAGAAGIPTVVLGGTTHVLTDIKSIKAALADLSNTIANPQVVLGSAQAVQVLQTIRGAIKDMQSGTKGLDIEPAGINSLAGQFEKVQAQAGRAFPELVARGGASADQLGRKWGTTGQAIQDTFRSMTLVASANLDKVAAQGGGVAARIAAAFQGLASGAGGGIGNIFGNLAQAAASSGGKIVSSLTPMIAIFTVVIQLLPALVAGFGALSTVFAALPQMVIAGVTAMTALKMAIAPVLQAIQAYSGLLMAQRQLAANPIQAAMQIAEQQNAVANAYYGVQQAAFQASQTQITNAHTVKDAQFALREAVRQSALSQVSDAHNVADAQFAVGQAYFQQSIQQQESAMSIAQAQHSLQDAIFATSQAQYQLNIAWQTAAEDLASLQLQVNYASTNLRGAQLGLLQAQQNYAQVMANSNATALERAQAAYQIKAAEEALAQVEQQNKDNEIKLGDVRKYGVRQVFGITQAQHALVDAQFAQIQAQKQLEVTQREAANAQITAAHEVKDAVFALFQAQKNQANDAIVNAHNIMDAQFALAQAFINQKEGFITSAHDQRQAAFQLQMALDQLALGLPSIAAAQANLATAMYHLGPAARIAVTDLEPLAKWFDTNKSVANSFFSQMLPSLSRISTIITPLSRYLNANARELGRLGNQALTFFERLMNSPAWKVFTDSTVRIIGNLGNAVGYIVKGFTDLAKVAVPFTTWLSHGIEDLAAKFDRWANKANAAGSDFRRWLRDVKPALDDVGHVIDAIVDGFAQIAGGPMGSPGSLSALKSFEDIMQALAKNILPNIFNAIHALTRPEMAAAIAQLFVALTNLLLVVVKTPGFQAGFNFMVRSFVALADVLAKIMATRGVGEVIGTLVGVTLGLGTALAALKFTGILSLITHFRQLIGYAQTFYNLLGNIVSKLTGGRLTLPGTGSGGTGTPSPTGPAPGSPEAGLSNAATQLSTAAADLSEAATKLGASSTNLDASAVDQKTAAADLATSSADLATSSTSLDGSATSLDASSASLDTSAVDLETAGAAGGSGKFLGVGGLGFGLAAAFLQFATEFHGFDHGTKTLWQLGDRPKTLPTAVPATPAEIRGANNTFVGPGGRIMFQPGLNAMNDWKTLMTDIGHFFKNEVGEPVQKFFTTLLPDWLGAANRGWSRLWNNVNTWWDNNIQGPVTNFFQNLIPDWLGAAGSGWMGLFGKIGGFIQHDVIDEFGNLFTNLIPDWLGAANTGWAGLFGKIGGYLQRDVVDGFTHFFGTLLPDWLGAANDGWSGLVGKMWHGFRRDLIDPVGNWFTNTLPTAIEKAFKGSVNWVITNVVNKAIGFINDVTHIVGIPKIPLVQTLASGGNVLGHSVSGAGDLDTAPALLTPGEFVIRKGARMALQARMGPDFLPMLNQYDQIGMYAAGGAVAHPASAPGGGAGPVYRNPLRDVANLTPLRVDMGVDYSGTGDVFAVGPGTIENITPQGWPGKSFIAERLSAGMYAGKLWYAAENIAPFVQVGQQVDSSTRIGHMFNAYPFSEWGFAANPQGLTEAAAHGQQASGKDPGAHTSAFGYLAAQFLHSLGAPMGLIQGSIFGNTNNWAAPATGFLGFLENVAGDLTGVGKFLGHLLGVGAGDLLGLASQGAESLFNAGWDHLIQPLLKEAGTGSVPGALLNAIMGNLHKGVDSTLGMWDQNNNVGFTPGIPMPRTAQIGREQAYARSLFPRFGWNANQLPYLIDLWNLESGWLPGAQNPTSTAYGIAQFLDTTWAAFGPKTSNPDLQILYGEEYIKDVYGDPAAADKHEHDFHWYWQGGDVINAVKQATRDIKLREAMLYGAMLKTNLDPGYAQGDRYGAWGINVKEAHIDKRFAQDPYTAAKGVLRLYKAGLDKYGWRQPREDALEIASYAEQSDFGRQDTSKLGAYWDNVLYALGLKHRASGVGPPTSHHGGIAGDDPAQLWNYYSRLLEKAVKAERKDVEDLTFHVPTTMVTTTTGKKHHKKKHHHQEDALEFGSQRWARWKAMDTILRHQWRDTFGENSHSAWTGLWEHAPDSMKPGEWDHLITEGLSLYNMLTGTVPRADWAWEHDYSGWPRHLQGAGALHLEAEQADFVRSAEGILDARKGRGWHEHRRRKHARGVPLALHRARRELGRQMVYEKHDYQGALGGNLRNMFLFGEELDSLENLLGRDVFKRYLPGDTRRAEEALSLLHGGLDYEAAHSYMPHPGSIEPSLWAFQKYEPTRLSKAVSSVQGANALAVQAGQEWKRLWGPGGLLAPGRQKGSPTPGPGNAPKSARPDQPSYYADILALASRGGPAIQSFARGGSVGDVAGMFRFASGGDVGADFGTVQALMRPGVALPSRGLSAAASATGASSNNIGLQFNGDINVSNPLPERASDSIAHSVQRMAVLAGRGHS